MLPYDHYARKTAQSQGPRHGRVAAGVWRKTVWARVHLLYSPCEAWAVDVADLEVAEALGAHTLEIRERGEGLTYRAPLALFRDRGFAVQRGHNVQVGLPLAEFEIVGKPEPVQGDLWAGGAR